MRARVPAPPLTACSQNLVNLLLTGAATPNVWDGVQNATGLGPLLLNRRPHSPAPELKGVATRTRVGFLTKLDALGYCKVGSSW